MSAREYERDTDLGAPTVTTDIPAQSTHKHSQKVKTAEAGIENQDQRRGSQTRMPSHIKTYDESEDPEDHIKIFQAATKTEQWAMPTWCHMFNSTLTGIAMKKCIKDPIKLHNIKQRYGESTKDFVRRYKLESRDVKGAPECMRISGFVHGITNPELIKRLHDKILKIVDEMMRVTTSFLMREVAASSHDRKKSFPLWKQQEGNQKQNFKKGGFRNQQRPERKHDRFTLLTKTPKEIFALEKRKFKAPPPMTTPVKKRNHTNFCMFHGEVGHNTDEWEDEGTEGPMITEAKIGGHCIYRMYVDDGSALETLGEIIWPIGQIQLLVKIVDEEHSTTARMNFVVVRSSSLYNGIIRRPGVRKLQAVPSTAHVMLKLPVEGGVITLKSSRLVPLDCTMVSGPEGNLSVTKQIVEERVKVAINPEYPEQTVMIGFTLSEEGHNKLFDMLQRNLDIFAWKPADMTGVPRHIEKHLLNIREGCPPVRQKKRGQAADRNQKIQEEVGKLVEAGIMKEVHYHDWLSNSVMVKKHDGSWRTCVDFKDLNKACPKDGYLLPEINWKVESMCGFLLKCFLDAYKCYHQIQMAKEDEEKTAFITSQGIICYTKMPFGLRNAKATYQRLVDKAFHKQIDRNIKVYVDDLVIKIRTKDEIVRDIEETFKTLREINMKLNPKKYKVDAVLSLSSPKCLKNVQKLNGKLASLNRFLAKSAEKSIPFFKTLKKCTKKSDFHWTAEAEEAFKQMKQLIAELPMLTAPIEKEELIVYLAAAKETVLADFIVERPEKDSLDTLIETEEELPEPWILFMDGSSCTDGFEAGLILTNPERMEFTYALRFRFDATNNEEEYEALIAELRISEQMDVKILHENVYSQLVANQVNGTYIAKEANIIKYLEKVRTLTSSFKAFSIRQVPRSKNKKTDALSKIASTSFAHLSKKVSVEELKEKSISKVEILVVVDEEGDTWMTPIFEYLAEETLPADVKEERAVQKETRSAVLEKSTKGLYGRGFAIFLAGGLIGGSLTGGGLTCGGLDNNSLDNGGLDNGGLDNGAVYEVSHTYVDVDNFKRCCTSNTFDIGYWVHKDLIFRRSSINNSARLSNKFGGFHFIFKFGISGLLHQVITTIADRIRDLCFRQELLEYMNVHDNDASESSQPSWGKMCTSETWLTLMLPCQLPGESSIYAYIRDLVDFDVTISTSKGKLGLPEEIILDNGKQFRDNPFKDWCEKLCIRQHFASIKHPKTNGLMERANRSLGEGIKARLDAGSKSRMEELSHVLWAHRTMIKSSNRDTPFSLTYGIEAVIPAEIGMPTLKTAKVDLIQNNEALEINLDLLEERREQASIREAKGKAKMERYYNSKVQNISFKPGDLVYRNNDASRAEDTGKLGPKWEGPYEVYGSHLERVHTS
nr:reverse transcriptase domain-containing protein [Tanacetum cinerariifolium]